jgi:hypothetical protein
VEDQQQSSETDSTHKGGNHSVALPAKPKSKNYDKAGMVHRGEAPRRTTSRYMNSYLRSGRVVDGIID